MIKLSAVSLLVGMSVCGAAFAQSTNPACAPTKTLASQAPASTGGSTTSMAATSSDSGQTGTGASSASIGTGTMDKTGVNSPCVPGISGNGAKGALPAKPNAP